MVFGHSAEIQHGPSVQSILRRVGDNSSAQMALDLSKVIIGALDSCFQTDQWKKVGKDFTSSIHACPLFQNVNTVRGFLYLQLVAAVGSMCIAYGINGASCKNNPFASNKITKPVLVAPVTPVFVNSVSEDVTILTP